MGAVYPAGLRLGWLNWWPFCPNSSPVKNDPVIIPLEIGQSFGNLRNPPDLKQAKNKKLFFIVSRGLVSMLLSKDD